MSKTKGSAREVAQGACQGHALALIFSICYFLEFGQVLDFSLYSFPSYKYVRSTQNIKTDTNVVIWLRNKLSNEKYFLDALDPQPKTTKTSKPAVLRPTN